MEHTSFGRGSARRGCVRAALQAVRGVGPLCRVGKIGAKGSRAAPRSPGGAAIREGCQKWSQNGEPPSPDCLAWTWTPGKAPRRRSCVCQVLQMGGSGSCWTGWGWGHGGRGEPAPSPARVGLRRRGRAELLLSLVFERFHVEVAD